MACRGCEERRAAMLRAAQAQLRGDSEAAAKEMQFVTSSAAEDARAFMRKMFEPIMPPQMPPQPRIIRRTKPAE